MVVLKTRIFLWKDKPKRLTIKKSRYSKAQIVSILKEAENSVPVSELCWTRRMSIILPMAIKVWWHGCYAHFRDEAFAGWDCASEMHVCRYGDAKWIGEGEFLAKNNEVIHYLRVLRSDIPRDFRREMAHYPPVSGMLSAALSIFNFQVGRIGQWRVIFTRTKISCAEADTSTDGFGLGQNH